MLRALVASSLMLATTGSLAVGDTPSTDRAAPEVIVFHGGVIGEPVYLTNWWENNGLLDTFEWPAPVEGSSLGGLPHLDLALFWGQGWGTVGRDPARRGTLLSRLDEAGNARVYLTGDANGAIVVYGTARTGVPNPGSTMATPRRVTPKGLAVFHRYGVPLGGVSDSTLVGAIVELFHDALANRDSIGAMDLLAADAVVLEAGARETREEYRAHHLRADMDHVRANRITRGPVVVTVRGDAAWAHSTTTTTSRNAAQPGTRSGAELMVLSKGGKGWQIRAIHWSSGRAN